MSQLGVAVIGAGPWGGTLARTFARVPGVNLRWICELDEGRRAAARARHPEVLVTASVDEALADPAVSAVVVAVDSARHHSVGLRVLAADCHLLMEKPLALSVADAAALCQAADARDKVLTVGHLLLHHPAVRTAKQMLDAGRLGTPLYFEARRTATGWVRGRGSAWWTLAPHDISLALHLFGATPSAVSAVGSRGAHSDEDVAAFATLHFGDGRLANIHVARLAARKERKFSLVGADGAVSFDELATTPTLRLSAPMPPGTSAPFSDIAVDVSDPLYDQCVYFAACAANGNTAGGNSAHGLIVVRVLAAGARSMASRGVPVEVM
jgi:predicted dehydrogenase